MACKKCGSDWVTATGRDCSRCPHCDKQQLHQARKAGRWVEPIEVKSCVMCGREFEAVGPKQIKQRMLCGDAECTKAHKKAGKHRRAAGVFLMQQSHGIAKPVRKCKRCGNGPLTRDQSEYCSRACAGADARELKRDFRGKSVDARIAIAIADFFYGWDSQRPRWTACEWCGSQIEKTSYQRRFCDDKCRYRYENPLPTACCDCGCEINSQHRNQLLCITCKKKRIRRYRRKTRRLIGNYRRRCRHYGVPYDPEVTRRKVLERDGYVCQLCGVKCLRHFTTVNGTPDCLSPTIDHIVALSMGQLGHTWDNVQCACWQCNVAKGAKSRGQLRLAIA